jgi:hypothetical protein
MAGYDADVVRLNAEHQPVPATSSRRAAYGAPLGPFDACCVSFPKCGRTWLRLMLGRTLKLGYGLSEPDDLGSLFDVQAISAGIPQIATVAFSHDEWPQYGRPSELGLDKLELYTDKTVIVLIRDLRDALVSNYFQLTRRERPARRYESISDYVRDEVGGAGSFVAFYNHWWHSRSVPRRFLVVRYEDLQADPARELQRVLEALEWPDSMLAHVPAVSAWGAFDNLRKLSKHSSIHELQPTDPADDESYKFRRGRVGGYAGYLSPEDIAFLTGKLEQLEEGYGY